MSSMPFAPRRLVLALGLSSTVLLAACGGGGGGHDDTPVANTPNTPTNPAAPTPVTLSGTAAAGAPLSGTVTVKDANGVTKTETIGTNGGYQVDVTGMTPPLVLRAQGTVGGRSYVLHSAASAQDVASSSTLNITPFTDLIVANIAGQIAANYFDSGSFSTLTQQQLNDSQAALRTRLQTVLTALGVESSIDLLRTSFAADHSGIDAALDVLRVSTDATTHTATITNLLNGDTIEDDLATTTDTAPLTNVANVATGADHLLDIVAMFDAFNTLFATELPSANAVAPYVHANFLDHDQDKDAMVADISSDPEQVGLKFGNIVITQLDGAAGTATVNFDVLRGDSKLETVRDFQLRRVDGAWQLFGDRTPFDIDFHAHTVRTRYKSGGNPASVTINSGIEAWVDDADPSNNGFALDHMIVTGPGLPAEGVIYEPQQLGGTLLISGENTEWHIMEDADILTIPDNATYTMTFYDTNDAVQLVKTHVLPRRPYARTEVNGTPTPFPTITSPTTGVFDTYAGGAMTITATVPSQAKDVWAYLGYTLGNGTSESVDTDTTVSNGVATTDITLPSANGQVVDWLDLRVDYMDTFERTLMTNWIKVTP